MVRIIRFGAESPESGKLPNVGDTYKASIGIGRGLQGCMA